MPVSICERSSQCHQRADKQQGWGVPRISIVLFAQVSDYQTWWFPQWTLLECHQWPRSEHSHYHVSLSAIVALYDTHFNDYLCNLYRIQKDGTCKEDIVQEGRNNWLVLIIAIAILFVVAGLFYLGRFIYNRRKAGADGNDELNTKISSRLNSLDAFRGYVIFAKISIETFMFD